MLWHAGLKLLPLTSWKLCSSIIRLQDSLKPNCHCGMDVMRISPGNCCTRLLQISPPPPSPNSFARALMLKGLWFQRQLGWNERFLLVLLGCAVYSQSHNKLILDRLVITVLIPTLVVIRWNWNYRFLGLEFSRPFAGGGAELSPELLSITNTIGEILWLVALLFIILITHQGMASYYTLSAHAGVRTSGTTSHYT